MPSKLVQIMNESVLRDLLTDDKPVEEIVTCLFSMGHELSTKVGSQSYSDWEEFLRKHDAGETELVELEGDSSVESDDVVVLRSCPMIEELKKLYVDGKPPACHSRIVEDYKDQNPGANSILHPGCIAHQVARQLIVKALRVEGENNINFYQLACRSGATGKVVYDDNGLKAIGMSEDEAKRLIDGYGCLYVMVRSSMVEKEKELHSTVGERN